MFPSFPTTQVPPYQQMVMSSHDTIVELVGYLSESFANSLEGMYWMSVVVMRDVNSAKKIVRNWQPAKQIIHKLQTGREIRKILPT